MIPDLIPTLIAVAGQIAQDLLALAIVLGLFVLYAALINGGEVD
jgi:hypothetical protein